MKQCNCIPGKYDPLSDILSHELDTGEERRQAQDWAEEARQHAEAAAQSAATAGAGAEAAAKSREDAAANADRAQAEAERAKGYADGVQTDHAYIEQALQEAQAAAQQAGEAAAKVSEADVDGKLAEMQKTAQAAKAEADKAADAAADAASSAAAAEAGAGDAMACRDAAKASETAAAAAADRAEKAVQNAQTASRGQKGYFADPDALLEAVPNGTAGDWAIVGSTDTVWVWDVEAEKWTDSGNKTDLSGYYTKDETDAALCMLQADLTQTTNEALQAQEQTVNKALADTTQTLTADMEQARQELTGSLAETTETLTEAMETAKQEALGKVRYLYSAILPAEGWNGTDDSGYDQTVELAPRDGGPAVTAGTQLGIPMARPEGNRAADEALQAALGIVNGGTATPGEGTVTVKVWEKPETGIKVFWYGR